VHTISMPDHFPTAFITWTTYGTWLPGDPRGWIIENDASIQSEEPALVNVVMQSMKEPLLTLSNSQREICDATIRAHCERRTWSILALNVRTNHVHIVVEADVSGWEVMKQLKSWCTRKLKEADEPRSRWWPRRGYVRYLEDVEAAENAIRYTNDG